MRVRNRRWMHPTGDQTGEMCHVDHEIGANQVRDTTEFGEVPEARVSRPAGDNDLRPMLQCETLQRLHVDPLIFRTHAVAHGAEPLAGHVGLSAMGKMASGG